MAGMKSLAKDTAIYGMSSIIGRFLNWWLMPLYVYTFTEGQYGIVTHLYAYTALLLVILTYGLETGFFRFANHNQYNDPEKVYTTGLISLGITSTLFFAIVWLFLSPITKALDIEGHADYVWMLALIVAIDAFTALPFVYLRYRKRPIRFASIKLLSIGINIGLNLFFILLCPWLYRHFPETIDWFYNPDYGIGYIFSVNLFSSIVILLTLFPEIFKVHYKFDKGLLKKMLQYSFPLLILGVAGIMNQTLDKMLFPYLASNQPDVMDQLGIYGACYKIAIIMMMFIQAFRFAYEPFIFSKNKGEDNKKGYADAMKFFIIFGLFIFLAVMFYIDIIRVIVPESYYSGLKVVPIIMLGEFFFGIFFNLSLWYKLTDKTQWGAWFSIFGCVITLLINILFVPRYGYIACAWAAFFCYLCMMLSSYFIGQKYYPIQYDLKTALRYILLSAVLYLAAYFVELPNMPLQLVYRTGLLLIFVIYLFRKDLPMSELPYIGKRFRK